MSKRRSSYSPTAAQRFLRYFNMLLEEAKKPEPQSLFIPWTAFGNTAPTTVVHRMTEALKYLRDHNLPGNKDHLTNRPYTPDDYEFLKGIMKRKPEATGLRLYLIHCPNVSNFLREEKLVQDAASWKDKIVDFVEGRVEGIVLQVENCIITEENLVWLKSVTDPIGMQYHVSGDKITLVKNA